MTQPGNKKPTGRPKGYGQAVAWIAGQRHRGFSCDNARALVGFLWSKPGDRVAQDVRRDQAILRKGAKP